MDKRRENPSYSAEVKLPSGRCLRVQYFERLARADECDLGLCGSCGCRQMQPVASEPMSESYWRSTLRCPNCLWVGTGVFTADALEQFAEMREDDVEIIRDGLDQLSLASMAQDAEQFVRALNGGHILPSDF